jgi:hypothetical protein
LPHPTNPKIRRMTTTAISPFDIVKFDLELMIWSKVGQS